MSKEPRSESTLHDLGCLPPRLPPGAVRGRMKRYAVLVTAGADGGWAVSAECDTLMEAVRQREAHIGYCQPLIVEVIPAVEAYAMAHREEEAAKIQAAYGKPR